MKILWPKASQLKSVARNCVVIPAALILAAPVLAQTGTSPWENAVGVLQQAFTSTIARGLSLVAIVVSGLTFAFGEGARSVSSPASSSVWAWLLPPSTSWLGCSREIGAGEEKTMSYARRINPIQRSLSRPLTILGAERKLFFFAMCLGAATFNLLNSLSGGVLMFFLLYFAARWATKTDPQILRLLLSAAKQRTQYDPMKFSTISVRRDSHA